MSQPWLLVALGLVLTVLCFAFISLQRRGPSEFGYAPFTPDALPWSAMRGFTWEQLHSHAYRLLLLGPGLALIGFGLAPIVRFALPGDRFWLRLAFACGAVCVGWMAFVMFAILRGRVLYDDELAYRMTADILARGKLSAPNIGYVPQDMFSVATVDGYTGKYLPGEPLLQIIGLKLFGVPAFAHLPLTALMLLLWYRTLRFDFALRTAAIATALLALSPTVILTGATGLTQLTSLFFVVCGGFGYALCRHGRALAGAALVGVSFGCCFLVRAQVALPANGVLVCAAAIALSRARRVLPLLLLGATLGAGLAAIGWYNHALSGSYTKLPWYLQCVAERFGFGRVWVCDGFEHNALTALENLAVVAARFNGWWLGLPLSLLPLLLWRVLGVRLGAGYVWLAVGLAVVLFEALYYSTGVSDTGALYHFELVLPAALLSARVLEATWERFPRYVPALLAVHLVLGTGSFLGEHTARLARLSKTIHATSDTMLAKISERPAILFHEFWGTELLKLGWVMDSFPKRFRDPSAPIVTFPRPPFKFLPNVLRAYPGRACYFFHRKPWTATPELLKCEDAIEFFSRGLLPTDSPPMPALWEPPTAYKKVLSFDPQAATRRRNEVFGGKPCILCCSERQLEIFGQPLEDGFSCVDPKH